MAGGREGPGAGGGDRGGGVKRTAPRALAAALLAVAGLVPSCGARTPLPSPEACEPIDLELVPAPGELDMYLMLDSSGSMEDPTLTGATKWVATTAALEEFFGSAQASGLGIALSYFPFIDPTVPELCGPTGNECGDPEDCILVGFCPESETSCILRLGCTEPGFPDEPCIPIGTCELDPEYLCAEELELTCLPGAGACLDAGYCDNHYSCEVDAYASAVVPVTTLPEGGWDLLAALQGKIPEGSTTTLPALLGAHEQARVGAAERSRRRHTVVFATDGFPTACDPSLDSGNDDVAIENLVAAAEAAAATGLRTFVVGVFTEEEAVEAQANLDAIARAGGTERAFIVGAEGSLANELASALEEARFSATACEYTLPASADSIDLELVSLVLATADGDQPLELLASASECASGRAGVYLVDGPDERRLTLCPSICAESNEEAAPPILLRNACSLRAD